MIASARRIETVRTENGQTIRVGDQVAYASAVSLAMSGGQHIKAHGGRLRVSRVREMAVTMEGWADADPEVTLLLHNGDEVNCTEVARTDGDYDVSMRYGS